MSKINKLNSDIKNLETLSYQVLGKPSATKDSLLRDLHIYRKALKDFYDEIKKYK